MNFRRNFVIGLGVLVACLIFFACEDNQSIGGKDCISGEGSIVSRELSIATFTAIDNQGTSNIIVSQGSTQKVVAIGHANILEDINTQVDDGVWRTYLKENCYTDLDLRFEVQMPLLEEISIPGTGNIVINDFDNQGDLILQISGTGNIDLGRFEGCTYLEADISGTGNINCNENWSGLEEEIISISGTGNFRAFPLITESCEISISSTGTCEVNVSKALDVVLSGSGSVLYKGSPEVNTSISGAGVIQKVN